MAAFFAGLLLIPLLLGLTQFVAQPGSVRGQEQPGPIVSPVGSGWSLLVNLGPRLDPAALLEFLQPRMAHFMIPRYLRVVDELPKTPTNKVQKHLLRDEGVTADTWDREAAGIRIRRERLTGA